MEHVCSHFEKERSESPGLHRSGADGEAYTQAEGLRRNDIR